MSGKNVPDVKRKSGADLRAQAEARLTAQQTAVEPKTPREQLDEYKETVRRGLRSFVEVGTVLGLILRLRLYREDGYASFDEFVTAEFEASRAWAYRAIDAARVITQLSQVETNASTITNQAQALELVPLVKSVEAMAKVVETAKARGPITAELLKTVRLELFPNPQVIDGEVVPDRAAIDAPKSPLVEAMSQAIEETAGRVESPSPDGPEHADSLAGAVPAASASTSPEADAVTPELSEPGANGLGSDYPAGQPGDEADVALAPVGADRPIAEQGARSAPGSAPEEGGSGAAAATAAPPSSVDPRGDVEAQPEPPAVATAAGGEVALEGEAGATDPDADAWLQEALAAIAGLRALLADPAGAADLAASDESWMALCELLADVQEVHHMAGLIRLDREPNP